MTFRPRKFGYSRQPQWWFVCGLVVWVLSGAVPAFAEGNCDGDPCGANGECVDLGNTFQCNCNTGWEGANCQLDADDCTPNPCLNGECVDLGTQSFACNCDDGWEGATCGVDTNDCEGNPCGGGSCLDTGVNSFECSQSEPILLFPDHTSLKRPPIIWRPVPGVANYLVKVGSNGTFTPPLVSENVTNCSSDFAGKSGNVVIS